MQRNAAQTLLKKVSQLPAIATDERMAIDAAAPLLRDTPRTATTQLQKPDGLLLLRVVVRSGTSRDKVPEPESAPPPRVPQPKEKVYWIEIELLDEADQPVPNERYKVELPDGEKRQGRLDSSGRAYLGDIKSPGACQVCFPEIDATEWRAA